MAQGDCRYVITVDATGAVHAVQDFDKAIEGLQKGAPKAAGGLRGLWQSIAVGQIAANAAQRAIGFLKDGLISTAESAMEAEKADRALASALEITGRAIPGLAEDLAAYASELQSMTVYDDEAIKGVETLLAQMTNLDKAGIERATRGAIGLASVMGMDLSSAGHLVQKAIEGNTAALSRYGIRIDDTLPAQEKQVQLLARLDQMFRRAKDATQTASGSLAQMRNTLDDAKEKIGGAFLPIISAGAQKIADLTAKIVGLNDALQNAGGEAKRQSAINEVYADTYYLITARAGRTQEYVANLAKLYNYNYKAILDVVAAGGYGKQLEGEWNRERDKTLSKIKAMTDGWKAQEKGTNKATVEIDKQAQAIQKLVDAADPVAAKAREIAQSQALLDAGYKSGKISASDYGLATTYLTDELRKLRDDGLMPAVRSLEEMMGIKARVIEYAPGVVGALADETEAWDTFLAGIEAANPWLRSSAGIDVFIKNLRLVESQLSGIASAITTGEEIKVENWYKKRLDYINKTISSETKKQKAIEALEAEYEIKKTAAKRKAAIEQKAVAMMETVVNTASAIVEALPNIPLAIACGIMGAAQEAIIASQPIPLAKGALFDRPTVLASGFLTGEVPGVREITSPEPLMRQIVKEETRTTEEVHFHISFAVNALDGASVEQMLKTTGVKVIQDAINRKYIRVH